MLFTVRVSAPRAMCSSLSLCGYRMLIGARNPMLCPIHVFRTVFSAEFIRRIPKVDLHVVSIARGRFWFSSRWSPRSSGACSEIVPMGYVGDPDTASCGLVSSDPREISRPAHSHSPHSQHTVTAHSHCTHSQHTLTAHSHCTQSQHHPLGTVLLPASHLGDSCLMGFT